MHFPESHFLLLNHSDSIRKWSLNDRIETGQNIYDTDVNLHWQNDPLTTIAVRVKVPLTLV